jgi:hypothetical protein
MGCNPWACVGMAEIYFHSQYVKYKFWTLNPDH